MSLASKHGAAANRGFLYAILAYAVWGILPLYWRALAAIDPLHILAFRILFSLAVVGIILLAMRNASWLLVFKEPKKAGYMILTCLVLSFNWGFYIWAVNNGHILEASMGYYITPLVMVVLGLLFFRECLRPLQWAAVTVALAGILILALLSGVVPWISLILALSFSLYGMLKKMVPLAALESLGAETLAGAPLGVLLLGFAVKGAGGGPAFTGLRGLEYLMNLPGHTWALLSLCGAVSALPLYLFARGAKLLPLSGLGFIQFLSPTIQFMLGVFVFGDAFLTYHAAAFGCIWIAVILYIISLKNSVKF
jgi:chloramphenicol-sensitive protein RarD